MIGTDVYSEGILLKFFFNFQHPIILEKVLNVQHFKICLLINGIIYSNCSEYYKQYIFNEICKLGLKKYCISFDAGQFAPFYNHVSSI